MSADVARRAIADAMLADEGASNARLGGITLRAHQRSAVERLRSTIDRCGGALLADEVGLGKTYVALALAADAARPLIVGPGSLRAMWSGALHRTGMSIPYISFEQLSRSGTSIRCVVSPLDRRDGRFSDGELDLVIIDEAHHLRNPRTNRYGALSAITRRARMLLLTATPVHNCLGDLCALLALFLGGRAWSMPGDEVARYVVRREHRGVGDSAEIPAVEPPRWVHLLDDSSRLERLLSLPAPLPPADGGDGGALLVFSLVRQWASSQGALRSALLRRVARATALAAALEAGRYPTSAELKAWSFADGAVQLAFPELLASPRAERAELLQSVRAHEQAVRELLDELGEGIDADIARATWLRDRRDAHRGEKVVAFSQFRHTIQRLFELLRREPGVAALSAQGARVAGGLISRREALARFAPLASGVPDARAAERIDLLLTTDLLSEGVNLQDASVVVHLDLPWTAARLEQRVGRVARLGSTHPRIMVYGLAPPASTEMLLGVERRLRDKVSLAAQAVGISGTILPPLSGEQPVRVSASQEREEIRRILGGWRERSSTMPDVHHQSLLAGATARSGDDTAQMTMVSAVRSAEEGFVAVASRADGPHLVAALGGALTENAELVLRALRIADSAGIAVSEPLRREALQCIGRWELHRRAELAAGVEMASAARVRRRVIDRIARITARAPPHLRPKIAALAVAARAAALAPAGIGGERVLVQLADGATTDEAWLRAVSTFAGVKVTPTTSAEAGEGSVLAIILLQRELD